jgi:hypothetical protein
MATIVNLTEQELCDLRAYTNQVDDAEAVRSAMIEYLRFARRTQLKAMSGTVQMEDNWQALESSELRDSNGRPGPGSS